MGLAEQKLSGKKAAHSWQAQRHREKMLNTSITNAPSLAIGMKLMAKMGWKDGQGLGANEQGIVEPIKLKQTINNKGLGYSRVTGLEQMHYSAHFERFESVLASLGGGTQESATDQNKDKTKTKKRKKENKLNGSTSKSANSEGHDTTSSSDESSDETIVSLKKNISQSLETLSRKVRGRFYRQKFARGKDVSRYSENDLACIVGSKAHNLYNANIQENGDSEKFVFGNLDSKEYFSQQSSALRTISGSRSASDTDEPKTFTPSNSLDAKSDNEEGDLPRPSFGGLGFGAAMNASDDEEDSARPAFGARFGGVDAAQKCFQDRFAANYMSAFVKADTGLAGTLTDESDKKTNGEESSSNDAAGCGELEPTETKSKKKRKKNKDQDIEVAQPELVVEDAVPKKKKKSKKEKKPTEEGSILPSEQKCLEIETEDVAVSEKKKKKRKADDLTECSVDLENVETESNTEKKKKKKKRKREEACEEVDDAQTEITEQDIVPNSDDVLPPKKKKSKRKDRTAEDSSVIEACQTDDTNSERKKKKKIKSSL